uniref:Uncharacterized protein n=1 Tax=Rhizophora mucronata TaxID=61149 RepID=A0A2P2NX74_RHIMU
MFWNALNWSIAPCKRKVRAGH